MIHFSQLAIGLVIDLSLRHHTDGCRYIDIVKKGLIDDLAVKLGLNCGVFVGHSDNQTMPTNQGESVAAISAYKEPLLFRIGDTLLQAVSMVDAQEADEKYVVLITDRYNLHRNNQYGYVLSDNKCKFLFVGIGSYYDRNDFAKFSSKNCQILHFDDPHQVGVKIAEVLNEKI